MTNYPFEMTGPVECQQLQDLVNTITYTDINSNTVTCIATTLNDTTVTLTMTGELFSSSYNVLAAVIGTYVYAAYTQYCYIDDIRTPGTNGGTSVADTWTIHPLNTMRGNPYFASVSANMIMLTSGIYNVTVSVTLYDPYNYRIRFRNVDTGDAEYSVSKYAKGIQDTCTYSFRLDLQDDTSFVLEYILSNAVEGIGLGLAAGYGPESFASVYILMV
jgi:hypothetical protein